ncbi:hypothetical protein ES703_96159 [subsurface metagenome]
MLDGGFNRKIVSRKKAVFCTSLSVPKDTLPIEACIIPVLSTLNSIFPAFNSVTALATSKVTVPSFALGIIPLGPKIRPNLPAMPIISGVATALSNSSQPFWIFSERSSAPTKSAPASAASFSFSPFAKTTTLVDFPMP